jgi:hypothetical protein
MLPDDLKILEGVKFEFATDYAVLGGIIRRRNLPLERPWPTHGSLRCPEIPFWRQVDPADAADARNGAARHRLWISKMSNEGGVGFPY